MFYIFENKELIKDRFLYVNFMDRFFPAFQTLCNLDYCTHGIEIITAVQAVSSYFSLKIKFNCNICCKTDENNFQRHCCQLLLGKKEQINE